MNNDELKKFLSSRKEKIDYVIDTVIIRGYDDIEEEFDDYNILIERYDIRETLAFELYENYFFPKRHEFELQLLRDIVEAISESKPLLFTFGAAAGGVIGGFAYDAVKELLKYITEKFKDKDNRRFETFDNIKNDVSKINNYFKKVESATVSKMEEDLGIDRTRIVPLLKLLGFKCRRGKKKNYWLKPR